MSDKNFEAQNAEVISMVKSGQRLPSVPCYFVSERKYRHYQALEAAAVTAKKQAQAAEVNHVTAVAARAGIGILFLGAVSRELIHPIFGVVTGLACFVWAWAGWRGR